MQEQTATQRAEEQKPKAPSAGAKLVSFLIVFGGLGFAAKQFLMTPSMQDIENKVATDAIAQYGIAKRGGDVMQTCVQAGMVTAALLQAKDEANYKIWKETERADCARAGIPK